MRTTIRYSFALCHGQRITLEEFLPALLGHPLAPYPGYDIMTESTVCTEYATVANRVFDSLAPAFVGFRRDDGDKILKVVPFGATFQLVRSTLTVLIETWGVCCAQPYHQRGCPS